MPVKFSKPINVLLQEHKKHIFNKNINEIIHELHIQKNNYIENILKICLERDIRSVQIDNIVYILSPNYKKFNDYGLDI